MTRYLENPTAALVRLMPSCSEHTVSISRFKPGVKSKDKADCRCSRASNILLVWVLFVLRDLITERESEMKLFRFKVRVQSSTRFQSPLKSVRSQETDRHPGFGYRRIHSSKPDLRIFYRYQGLWKIWKYDK